LFLPGFFRVSPRSSLDALAACCASYVKPQKIADQAIFTPDLWSEQTPRRLPANAEAVPIIGIFALLMPQKSTSATGCQDLLCNLDKIR
jgi:hypothetical protein